jgi:hypothetical protein
MLERRAAPRERAGRIGTMAFGPCTLSAALADSPAAPLLHRLAQSQSVLAAVRPIVENIVSSTELMDPGAAELRGGALILTASSATTAAKLRQALPTLLHALHQQGAQVNEIRLRVQPKHLICHENRQRGPIGQAAEATLASALHTPANLTAAIACTDKLALALKESPLRDAVCRLKRALERLAQTR